MPWRGAHRLALGGAIVLAGCESPGSPASSSAQGADTATDASRAESQDASPPDASWMDAAATATPADAQATLADAMLADAQATLADADAGLADVGTTLADPVAPTDAAAVAVFACGSTYCVSGVEVCAVVTGCLSYVSCEQAPIDGGDPCTVATGTCVVDVQGNATITQFLSHCACYGAPPVRRDRRRGHPALAQA